mmetsp:Transcript_19357/g.51379  ORF Transcript_19357/g.51379 Transcript_19357/m.51379 type:complete len:382 (+) Transcript_19357:191-1336(+)
MASRVEMQHAAVRNVAFCDLLHCAQRRGEYGLEEKKHDFHNLKPTIPRRGKLRTPCPPSGRHAHLEPAARHGKLRGKLHHLLLNPLELLVALHGLHKRPDRLRPAALLDLVRQLHQPDQKLAHLDKVRLLQPAARHRGGPDAAAAGVPRGEVARDRVLVERDVCRVADLLHLVAGDPERAEVPEEEVVFRAAGLERVALGDEEVGECRAVGLHLHDVRLEFRGHGFLEGDAERRDGVVVGAALAAREDGLLDAVLVVVVLRGGGFVAGGGGAGAAAVEDEALARPAEGFVGGGGDDVAELEGVLELLGGDEARDVGHVAVEDGADLVGDGAEPRVVEVAGVRGGAADEELGAEKCGEGFEVVVVDVAGFGVDGVGERLEVN